MLSFAVPETPYAVILGFDERSELFEYYINLEDPLTRSPAGFDTADHLLDVTIPPDLTIEVVSPNDLAYEVEQKVEEYLDAGIRMVWVVFPNTKTINIYQIDRSVQKLSVADTITAGDVIPGFSAPVRAIFEMPTGS